MLTPCNPTTNSDRSPIDQNPDSLDGLATALERSKILSIPLLHYNSSIRSLLEPVEKAIYGASGADFSGFHSTINARVSLFVSDFGSINLGATLRRAIELLSEGPDLLTKDPAATAYRRSKCADGFAAHYELDTQYSLARALAVELNACGAESLRLDTSEEICALHYSLPSNRQDSRKEHVTYFLGKRVEDLTGADLDATLGGEVDVYHHRAAMSLPFYYDQLRCGTFATIFNRMPIGGKFITDDIGIQTLYARTKDCAEDFPIFEQNNAKVVCLDTTSFDRILFSQELVPPRVELLYGKYLRVREKQSRGGEIEHWNDRSLPPRY